MRVAVTVTVVVDAGWTVAMTVLVVGRGPLHVSRVSDGRAIGRSARLISNMSKMGLTLAVDAGTCDEQDGGDGGKLGSEHSYDDGVLRGSGGLRRFGECRPCSGPDYIARAPEQTDHVSAG